MSFRYLHHPFPERLLSAFCCSVLFRSLKFAWLRPSASFIFNEATRCAGSNNEVQQDGEQQPAEVPQGALQRAQQRAAEDYVLPAVQRAEEQIRGAHTGAAASASPWRAAACGAAR